MGNVLAWVRLLIDSEHDMILCMKTHAIVLDCLGYFVGNVMLIM